MTSHYGEAPRTFRVDPERSRPTNRSSYSAMLATRFTALLPTRFLRFFVGSAGGLTVDLVGFALLTGAGIAPGVANLISSFTSITIVYVAVTRFAFSASATARTYVAFLLWYSSSIAVFSTLIELVSTATAVPPLVCKIVSIPISFSLNYAFSRWLFRSRVASASGRGARMLALRSFFSSAR